MTHSPTTGADVAHAGVVKCRDVKNDTDVVMSISGTSLLPGNEHSDPPVGKQITMKIYGNEGSIIYVGDTRDRRTGDLELREVSRDGVIELPAGSGFDFEALDNQGTGPESLQSFLSACLGEEFYHGADALVGLRTVQVLDAMYRSNAEGVEVVITR